MPRPKRNRADALKAAAAREAVREAKAAAAVATRNNGDNDDTGSIQTRLAQEQEAASRAIRSIKSTRTKVMATPRQERSRSARVGQAAPSTLQVQRSQESVDPPPTSTRARNVPMAPMSVRKPMSTPRAEASMMALANFKRRSRAPSVLGIGDADETASISSGGSFGDLMPDDESTPLPKTQLQRQLDHQLIQSKTPEGEHTIIPPRSNSSLKRKRDSAEILVPFSQSQDGATARETRGMRKHVDSDNLYSATSEEAESDSLPDIPLPQTEPPATPRAPSLASSILAPPASSSSPVKIGAKAVNIPGSPAPARKPRAEPSPGIAKEWARARTKKAAKALDTAALQQLLPRRRAETRGTFDIYSSDGPEEAGTDTDELSHVPSKRTRTAKRSKKQREALSETKSPAKQTKKGTRRSARNVAPASKRVSRTYSRLSTDKENTPASEGNEVFSPPAHDSEASADVSLEASRLADVRQNPSQELQSAAKKFAEVDEWEMDFEDVVPSSSVMADAR